MSAVIFDIKPCPVCGGEKKVYEQMMKNNKTNVVVKKCAFCKGKGRIGVKREEVREGE